MDNLVPQEAQQEEILALQSIYEEKYFIVETQNPPRGRCIAEIDLPRPFYVINHADVTESFQVQYLPPFTLFFEFPTTYPAKTCPAYLLSCKWLKVDQLSKLCEKLDSLWMESSGEVILFRWIQFLQQEALELLGINNQLDITELSKYNIMMFLEDSPKTNEMEVVPTSCDKSDIFSSNETSEKPAKKTAKISKYYSMRQNIKPSVSGGSGIFDSRAVLDLTDGRSLRASLKEYNNVKLEEEFQHSMHTCKICYSDKKGDEFITLKLCKHRFCKECLESYFKLQVTEGNVFALNCPDDSCSLQADDLVIRQLIDEDLYARYDSLLLQRTLETMSDIVYCPREQCQCPVLLEPCGKMGYCTVCSFVFCAFCKMAFHGVAPCNFKSKEKKKIYEEYIHGDAEQRSIIEKRYGKRAIQSLVEDTLSEGWITSNSKQCPQCNASIEKMDGCNKMTCFKCNSYFCWLCGEKLKAANPYSHFEDFESACFNRLFPVEEVDVFDEAFDAEPGEFLQ